MNRMSAFMLAAVPVLPCNNIQATILFYEMLGFSVETYPNYMIVHFQQAEIHFWLAEDVYLSANSGCYVHIRDIDFFYESYKALGIIHPEGQLKEKPWGMKEFAILDNSGNLLRFGENI